MVINAVHGPARQAWGARGRASLDVRERSAGCSMPARSYVGVEFVSSYLNAQSKQYPSARTHFYILAGGQMPEVRGFGNDQPRIGGAWPFDSPGDSRLELSGLKCPTGQKGKTMSTNESITNGTAAGPATGSEPLTPEAIAEQLRALRSHVPDFTHLRVSDARSLRVAA